VHHTVEVAAESLYEAVARSLSALRANSWVGEIGEGAKAMGESGHEFYYQCWSCRMAA
jgi:hypothetical protein